MKISAVFEASDGSRSEYIFDEEIKYVDDNGAIADKSNPDEYLVCLRVGKNSDTWDYHFWFRASNGKWYDKHGWNSHEECLGSITNPGNVSSTCPGWALTYNYTTHYNFYTSNILYYAVKI